MYVNHRPSSHPSVTLTCGHGVRAVVSVLPGDVYFTVLYVGDDVVATATHDPRAGETTREKVVQQAEAAVQERADMLAAKAAALGADA